MKRLRFLYSVVTVFAWTGVAGCGDGEPQEPLEPTYANVEEIFVSSCGISDSCHAGRGVGRAYLNFEALEEEGRPLTEALNDVPACEYQLMDRVEPGDPENSWLWIKLDPSHMDGDGVIDFEPDPSFDATEPNPHYDSSSCPIDPSSEDAPFGLNMPQSRGSPSPLSDRKLEAIRQWIEMGAPGPDGVMPDAGMDAGTDAGADAGSDAGVDASTDAGSDATTDGG